MNNNSQLDMLQIKINQARDALPKATRKAIDSVDWRAFILSLREKKGYSFEQLEDLEIETELLLCGLLDPRDYPKTLEEELKLPKAQIDLLVEEMNQAVFEKIKNELIKNTEKEDIFVKKEDDLPLAKREEEALHSDDRANRQLSGQGGGPSLNTVNIEPVDTHTMSPNIVKINNSPFLNKKTVEENKISIKEIQKTPLTNLPLSKEGEKALHSDEQTLKLNGQEESPKTIEIMPKEIQAPEQKEVETSNKEIIANALKREMPKAEQSKIPNPETKKVETPLSNISQGDPKRVEIKPETMQTENNATNNNLGSIFSQKLSGSFKLPTIKTNYTETSTPTPPLSTKVSPRKADPYRIDPNE